MLDVISPNGLKTSVIFSIDLAISRIRSVNIVPIPIARRLPHLTLDSFSFIHSNALPIAILNDSMDIPALSKAILTSSANPLTAVPINLNFSRTFDQRPLTNSPKALKACRIFSSEIPSKDFSLSTNPRIDSPIRGKESLRPLKTLLKVVLNRSTFLLTISRFLKLSNHFFTVAKLFLKKSPTAANPSLENKFPKCSEILSKVAAIHSKVFFTAGRLEIEDIHSCILAGALSIVALMPSNTLDIILFLSTHSENLARASPNLDDRFKTNPPVGLSTFPRTLNPVFSTPPATLPIC